MGRKVTGGGWMVLGLALWTVSAPAVAEAQEIKGLLEYRKGDTVIVGGQRVRVTDAAHVSGS